MPLARHTIRDAAGAALTIGRLQIGRMFGAVSVVEAVCNRPGIGLHPYRASTRTVWWLSPV